MTPNGRKTAMAIGWDKAVVRWLGILGMRLGLIES